MSDSEAPDALGLDDETLLASPPPRCGTCGGTDVVPRVFGLPSAEDPLLQRVERGEVDAEFAGCVVPEGPLPVWRCRGCGGLMTFDGDEVED